MNCDKCKEEPKELLDKFRKNEFDGYSVPRPDTVHEAELKCRWCGRFICWIPKTLEEKKRWQTPETNGTHCEMCRVLKGNLGDNETLHTHHRDGNPKNNDPFNLWTVCTNCHALIHHQITYRNHYVMKINRIISSQQ